MQSEKILKIGIEKYNLGQWVECIKIMEKLKQFVIKNNFSKTLQYYDKAKEYTSKSVSALAKTMSKDKTVPEPEPMKVEYDEIAADKKYTDGLVLYARGKYYEAERSWELALRLNPNHRKAKVALKKLKKLKNHTSD
jgi:tetratricopeptide (TPR) repeat protein